MSNIEMKYGDYVFSPVPLATISRDYLSSAHRPEPLGYTFRVTLNGELFYPDGGLVEGRQKMESLREAFNQSGKLFLLTCDGEDIIRAYPRIISINFSDSPNNWVFTIPYTIELEYDVDQLDEHPTSSNPFIENFTEEWQFEFIQDTRAFSWDLSVVTNQIPGLDYTNNDQNNLYEARVTHNLSVKGKQTWSGPGIIGTHKTAVQNALDWINTVYNHPGYVPAFSHALFGWLNLSDTGHQLFDHYRTHSIIENEGTVNLSESWLVLSTPSGSPQGITEEFSVSIRDSKESPIVSVNVEGTIRGYETRSYSTLNAPTNTIVPAFQRAVDAFNIIRNRIFPRAQLVYQQHFTTGTLHPQAVTANVGYQPSHGIISYSFEFDNRPCNLVANALSENITISDEHAADVFARIPVLGRAQGPVLQAINTITELTREITIELVMPLPTSCNSLAELNMFKPDTNQLLCLFEQELTAGYDQVFKNKDTENWNPLTGRYTRTVGWTFQSCTNAPSTSHC